MGCCPMLPSAPWPRSETSSSAEALLAPSAGRERLGGGALAGLDGGAERAVVRPGGRVDAGPVDASEWRTDGGTEAHAVRTPGPGTAAKSPRAHSSRVQLNSK